jgi:hypothetical protein
VHFSLQLQFLVNLLLEISSDGTDGCFGQKHLKLLKMEAISREIFPTWCIGLPCGVLWSMKCAFSLGIATNTKTVIVELMTAP